MMFILSLQLIQDASNSQNHSNNIKQPKYSVAFITKLYRGGGLERVTQLLSTYLSQQNIGVFLITGEPTEHDFQVPDNVRRLVAFAENDGIREDTPSEENLRRMQAKNELLLQYHREHGIQLFVCQEHWAHGNYETINFLKDHNIKVIAIEHNFFLFPFYDDREYLFKISQRTYPRLDALVCLNRVDVQLWRKVGVKNAIYIPNLLTFDPDSIAAANLSSNNIIMLGRFQKAQKQQHLAIQMMRRVIDQYPDAQLQIVGDSDPFYFQECQQYMLKYKVYYNVQFIPFQTYIKQYYENAALMVVTSSIEGFSMVLVEAKAFGIPTVAFNLKYAELWQDGITTVDRNDVDSLADNVVSLLKDRDLRLRRGKEAKQSLDRFDVEKKVQKWVALITAVIDGDEDGIQQMKESEEKVAEEFALNVLKEELGFIQRDGYDFGFRV
ncbi:Glycosyl_transferases group [Hexamita inflata]|uniref:Glycosyl transferases group n=1 Tax=Hexamita inflata TaxID=28002 RepID=A0AA86Q424_9EUKA|nr:Glycosyl transferases group [Hexamita inflata]